MRPSPGPAVDDPGFVNDLRDALARVGYTADGVLDVLPAVRFGLRAADVPVYERQLPRDAPVAALVRLFLLGLPVGRADLDRALAPLDVAPLAAARLVDLHGDVVTSRTQLLCVRDLLLFGDRDDALLSQPGWVSASSPTAQVLDRLTVPARARSALDLGCGSGMHGLLAVRRSEHVVATDVNERAVAYTRFNALLNGAANLVCRHGSWFEPVGDDRFDLVVSNPPFVISPDAELVFRDSPLPGDDVSRMVVAETATHLTDGGYGHVLCNWALRSGDSWDDPPSRWVEATGCDALIVHFGTEEPLSYAAVWNAPLHDADPSGFTEALDRWVEHYDQLGIVAMCAGAVVLRRRYADRHWVRAVRLRRPPEMAAGDDVLSVFAGMDLAEARPGVALRDAIVRLVEGHEVRQVLQHRSGGYDVQRCTVARAGGLGLEIEVDPEALQVVLRLDGVRTVAEISNDVAQQLGVAAGLLTDRACVAVDDLLRQGLAQPG